MEDTLAAPYMVDDARQLCRRLVKAGVHVIFTGHLHISDIGQTSVREGNMVEVATAAAVGYPCQWRVATCNTAAGKMQLRSVTLHSLPSDPEFGEHAREVFKNCIPTMTQGVLTRYWPEISQAIDNLQIKHPFLMRFINIPDSPEAIAELINRLIKGIDQVVNQTVKGILKPFVKLAFRLRIYKTFKLVLRSILEDLNDISTSHETVINDHTAIIEI